MYTSMLLMILCPIVVNCCDEVCPLKIEYLEELLNASIKNSQTYKQRIDNSKFFRNGNYSDKIIEYGTFDFIVVGGGSSGSVVSSRLSEVEKWDILLLEAGGFDDDLTDIPYIYRWLHLSERNWGYFTVPQKNGCFGLKNRQAPYERGKVLGGSGTINGLAYVRGNRGDYDKWASLGNPGWSFDDILPYFKKMENWQSDKIDLRFRGFGGPLNVAYKEPKSDLSEIISSFYDLEIKYLEDYNAVDQIGASRNQRNIKCGKRVSGATAYVRPSMNRHNFNLTLRSLVTKIIVDKSTKTARGVEFVREGKKYRALAKKEVIISGGAINSPQLLMLSGIGPADELQKHNISKIQALPVGQYLKDHYSFPTYYRSNQTTPTLSYRELLEEYVQGRGMLTNLDNKIVYNFMNSENRSATVPNLEFVLVATTPVPKPRPQLTNYIQKVDKYFEKINEQTDHRFVVFILHPKSVGSIKLQSSSPKDFPLIDTAIYSAAEDLELTYQAARIFESLEKTTYAKKLNLTKIDFDFCDEYERYSKPYWLCAIQHIGEPSLHMCSTCKMGPPKDKFAVVDNKLKVYGIKNLRVADCSIMPDTISGHNNAAAFVIGEKAADLIKKDHGIPIRP